MKIELEIKDPQVAEKVIIFVGFEVAAFKNYEDDFWHIKETSCNQCGECCLSVKGCSPVGTDEEGKCLALKRVKDLKYLPPNVENNNGWVCSKFKDRPLRCLQDPIDPHDLENCSITYKKVKA